jgi:uncharacterized protein (TIGR02145 family)
MKKYLFYPALIIMILSAPGCHQEFPGKVEILSVDDVTHNSMVVKSSMKDIGRGVGLQSRGTCLSKSASPDLNAMSFTGVPADFPAENCLTGISGLEPDTRYILRAYYETNEGTVYSDTLIIKTKPVNFMTDPRDGRQYPVKQYGKQIWMVRNISFQTPGSILFQYNAGKNTDEFGRLYLYAEAVHACPPGWHLPSDAQWKELEKNIGIPESDLDRTAFRGSPSGGMMKEPGMRLWLSESALHSTNKSAFTVVPSGWYRTEKKEFTDPGTCAGFWSLSEDSASTYARFFYANTDAVSRNKAEIGAFQLSLRCVMD